jgi:chloride channel 7
MISNPEHGRAVVSVTVRVLMNLCAAGDSCGFFGAGGFIYFEIREGQDAYEVRSLL